MGWFRKNTVIILFVAFVAVAGLCAAVILAPPPANVAISGTLILGGATDSDLSGVKEGEGCGGRRSLADITGGAKVTVFNGRSNTELKTSVLEAGEIDDSGNCVFKFSVSGVSKVTSYSINIGQRPRYQYSYNDLVVSKFKIKLVMGEVSEKKLSTDSQQTQSSSASRNYQMQEISPNQVTGN